MRLTVRDNEGATAVATKQITIAANRAPTAVMECTAYEQGTTIVDCDGSSSSDPEDGEVAGYSWDFGDPASGSENTSSASFERHNYTGPGTYTITLTVTDDAGSTASTSRTVTVSG